MSCQESAMKFRTPYCWVKVRAEWFIWVYIAIFVTLILALIIQERITTTNG